MRAPRELSDNCSALPQNTPYNNTTICHPNKAPAADFFLQSRRSRQIIETGFKRSKRDAILDWERIVHPPPIPYSAVHDKDNPQFTRIKPLSWRAQIVVANAMTLRRRPAVWLHEGVGPYPLNSAARSARVSPRACSPGAHGNPAGAHSRRGSAGAFLCRVASLTR